MRRVSVALALVVSACANEAATAPTDQPPATTTTVVEVTTTSRVTATTATTTLGYPYDFEVHAEAPVLRPQTWHRTYTAVPWIVVQGETWHMFFSGTDGPGSKLGWATSTDGVSWDKETLVSPLWTPDGGRLGWFFIFEVDAGWEMLYVDGFTPPYRNVSRATAPDLAGPWEDQGEALAAPDRDWDRFIVPTGVTRVGDTYFMPYGGWGQQEPVPAIGIMTSMDGLNWEPTTETPIYTATEGSWNEAGVVPMNVVETERGLELFFLGFNEQPKVGYQADVIPFGRLVSTDGGITWVADNGGLPIGDTGEKGWPGMAVVYDEGRYWLYMGDDLGSRGISLVTGTIP